MKWTLLFFIVVVMNFTATFSLRSQTSTLNERVLDETGNPLAHVNVTVHNTYLDTSTDTGGKFVITGYWNLNQYELTGARSTPLVKEKLFLRFGGAGFPNQVSTDCSERLVLHYPINLKSYLNGLIQQAITAL